MYASSGVAISMIRSKIEGLQDEVNHLFPRRLFNKREHERKGYSLAVEQALDIINSIESRFVTGGGDDGPRFHKNYHPLYEVDGLFD